jgi:hypothetical protein
LGRILAGWLILPGGVRAGRRRLSRGSNALLRREVAEAGPVARVSARPRGPAL